MCSAWPVYVAIAKYSILSPTAKSHRSKKVTRGRNMNGLSHNLFLKIVFLDL